MEAPQPRTPDTFLSSRTSCSVIPLDAAADLEGAGEQTDEGTSVLNLEDSPHQQLTGELTGEISSPVKGGEL